MTGGELVPIERIRQAIILLRGQKVMLDRDLAVLYGVPTKALKRAVRRHVDRFPEDFMFVLTAEEFANWRRQFGASNSGRMGLRHAPMAFELEKYDAQFKIVFDAIRQLMTAPEPPPKKIGFSVRERRAVYSVKKTRAAP